MYAKKSLGQHFLHNPKILSSIIDAGDISALDIVLEIGPGHGALTKKLLFFAGKVVAVEKDRALVEELQQTFAKEIASGKLELTEKDILDFDTDVFAFYKDLEYKVVANIPYNITGAILKKLFSSKCLPETMVLLVQKEVAERIVAKDGKESILSLSVKAYGTPKIVKIVGRGNFQPQPNVDSAILLIENISRKGFKTMREEEAFFRLIKAGFAHKRKKLMSNLRSVATTESLEKAWKICLFDDNVRAEDLTLRDWVKLAPSISEKL